MSLPESGTVAVLAEQPSVARDIARALGRFDLVLAPQLRIAFSFLPW
jgi:hypothetical protein